MQDKTKICLGCKVEKSMGDFYNRPVSEKYPDGKRSRCKKCENIAGKKWAQENKSKNAEQSAKWRRKNPEKHKQSMRKYYLTHKKELAERNRQWRENNKEYNSAFQKKWREENKLKVKGNFLRRKYGISLSDYEALGNKQDWRCAICLSHSALFFKGLFVDHCHSTNKIRGLLCPTCNLMLGYSKDSIEILKNAVKYLSV